MGEHHTFAVPRPPTVFVGRGSERSALGEAIELSAVTVLYGRSGLGKTSLIAKVLAQREGVVRYLQMIPNAQASPATLAQLLLDADLGAWKPGRAANLEDAMLSLVEETDALVVVDAIDGDARWAPLLRLLSEHAARGRWVFVSPRRPARLPPSVNELEIGPLPHEHLHALVCELAPHLDDVDAHELASNAGGSPRVALGLLEGPDRLGPEAELLLGLLQLVDTPLPGGLVADQVDALSDLQRSGYVDSSDAGWSVTPEGRGHAKLPRTPDPHVLGALLRSPRTDLFLAGVRLAVFAGTYEQLGDVLEERWPRLRGTPQVVSAFESLRHVDHPAIRLPRLRMAIDLGDASCRTGPAEGLTFAEEVDRVLAVVRLGVTAETRSALDALVARTDGTPEEKQRATIYAAWLALWSGDAPRARQTAEGLAPINPELELRRASVLARAADVAGDEDATELERRVATLVDVGPRLSVEAAMDAARCLHLAGHSERALEALDLAAEDLGVSWQKARLAQQLRLISLVAMARVPAGRALVERLEPFVVSGSQDEPLVEWVGARLDLIAGDVDSAEKRLRGLIAKAESPVYARFVDASAALSVELGILTGDEVDASLADRGELAAALFARWSARRGNSFEAPDTSGRIAAIQYALARAESNIIVGRFDAADETLRGVIANESETVYVLDAHELLADVSVLRGRGIELDAYTELAASTGSGRYRSDVDFYALVSGSPRAHDLAHGCATSFSPRASRRYRALLGMSPALDELDRNVCEAIRTRLGWSVEWLGAPPDEPVFVDLAERSVQRGGLVISLARRNKPWSVLSCLLEHGGVADKETLVTEVWNEDEYHPLKHDNRLQAAVSQLRKALSDLEERFVESTDDGYALTLPVGVVSVEAPR